MADKKKHPRPQNHVKIGMKNPEDWHIVPQRKKPGEKGMGKAFIKALVKRAKEQRAEQKKNG